MTVVVIGGTAGLGLEVARHYSERGARVVICGRDQGRARSAAVEIGGDATGTALDLADPSTIAPALEPVEQVDRLVIAAIERDSNSVGNYDVGRAMRLVALKLVGYTEAVHVLAPRFSPQASVVLFGGLASERPFPGSTTVSTVNGGISALTRTLAIELAPVRVNAIHPGVIGDSPAVQNGWTAQATGAVVSRTPLGRLVTMREIVGAVTFLLENTGVNGVNLAMDGGWVLR
jgi:NAD(P)-dependent dehydrogenase (short-subunit alcohol dehydrogenase family)